MLRAAKEEVEDWEGDLEGGKKKETEVFEVEDQALLYIKSPGSTIVTRVEEIYFTRLFRRWVFISGGKGRRARRCCRWWTTMPVEKLRVGTRDGRM